jgi:hypothetical protein
MIREDQRCIQPMPQLYLTGGGGLSFLRVTGAGRRDQIGRSTLELSRYMLGRADGG